MCMALFCSFKDIMHYTGMHVELFIIFLYDCMNVNIDRESECCENWSEAHLLKNILT